MNSVSSHVSRGNDSIFWRTLVGEPRYARTFLLATLTCDFLEVVFPFDLLR